MRNRTTLSGRATAMALAVGAGLFLAGGLHADDGQKTSAEKVRKALQIAAELEAQARRLQSRATQLASEADAIEAGVPDFAGAGTVPLPEPKTPRVSTPSTVLTPVDNGQRVAQSDRYWRPAELPEQIPGVIPDPMAATPDETMTEEAEPTLADAEVQVAKRRSFLQRLFGRRAETGEVIETTEEVAIVPAPEGTPPVSDDEETIDLAADFGDGGTIEPTVENGTLEGDSGAVLAEVAPAPGSADINDPSALLAGVDLPLDDSTEVSAPESTPETELANADTASRRGRRSVWAKLFGSRRVESDDTGELSDAGADISAMSPAGTEFEGAVPNEADFAREFEAERAAAEAAIEQGGEVIVVEPTPEAVEVEPEAIIVEPKAEAVVVHDAAPPSSVSPDTKRLIDTLRLSTDYQEQSQAQKALIAKGPSVTPAVKELLGDTRTLVRVMAVIILRETRGPGSYRTLYELLGDSDPQVRYQAHMALVKMTGRTNTDYHFNDVAESRSRGMQSWWNILTEMNLTATPEAAQAEEEEEKSRSRGFLWWRKEKTEEAPAVEVTAEETALEEATPWWKERKADSAATVESE